MTRRIWIYEEANLDTCLTPVPQQSWDSEWLQQGVPTATCACYHSRRIWFVLARREVCGKSSPNWVVCEVMGVPLVIIHWNRLFPSSRNHPAISSWGYSRFPTGNHEASETECSVTDYNKDGEPSGFSTQCVKEGTACPCGKNTISCPDPNDVPWRFPIHGGIPKSSIYRWNFQQINHPAIGVPFVEAPRSHGSQRCDLTDVGCRQIPSSRIIIQDPGKFLVDHAKCRELSWSLMN